MTIHIDSNWRIRAQGTINLPISASAVWGQMRDLRRFLSLDPLHTRVHVEGRTATELPRPGDRLVIPHRFLGIGPDRVGRILRWDDGRGYIVSDLSRRGVRVGFPHVCECRVEPTGAASCRVVIGARGKWTATRWPRWAVRLWMWWVMRSTEACLRQEMRRYARWLRRQRHPLTLSSPPAGPAAAAESAATPPGPMPQA